MHAGGCGEWGEKDEPSPILALQKYPSRGHMGRCTNTQPAPMEEAEPQEALAKFSGIIEDEQLADCGTTGRDSIALGLQGKGIPID